MVSCSYSSLAYTHRKDLVVFFQLCSFSIWTGVSSVWITACFSSSTFIPLNWRVNQS